MTAPRLNAGGTIAGKYSVRRILGDGGSVITYHCANAQGQEFAVKLYDPAVAGHASVMKALEQAYAATNALPQNSASPIIDAGYDQPTVAPYSATEMLRLPSLGAQQRRFSPEEVVGLLKGLARSLDLAHLRQVVHGALKPTNVFLGPNANPVIVTDFAANLPKAAIPTQEGYSLSAPWIAPEQAQSGALTAAVDVFSSALVAFFALTGRSYWRSCQGPTLDLAGWQQELGSARAPASSRATEMGVPLSPSMDAVFWKALSVDPKDRYRSLGEFANVLEEGMRQQVGSAATMALPLVGEPPSPLPPHLQKQGQPQSSPPGAGVAGAATMALPLSALMPPGAPQGVPPAPPPPNAGPMLGPAGAATANLPQQMGMHPQQMQQMQQMQGQMYPPQGHDAHGQQMHGMEMHPQQMQQQMGVNGANALAAGSMGGPVQAQHGYAQNDAGYPPPPMGLQSPHPQSPRSQSKSKLVPIVIGFTAIALLGAAAAVWVVKVRNAPPVQTGPVNVPASSGAPKPPEPKPTETASAEVPTATATASASAAPTDFEIKITCSPSCDTILIDNKAINARLPIMLKAGEHEVVVNKAGYVSQTDKIQVEAGPTLEKTYTLEAKPQATGPVPVTGPRPQPCKQGSFIKKCK